MIDRGAALVRGYLNSVRRVAVGLLVLTALEITVLVFLRVLAPHSALELAVQIALGVTFAALAAVELRAALAVAVLELIVGGGSGRWTELPAGVTGRMLLDATIAAVALVLLVKHARGGAGRRVLGQYGANAALVAIVVPAVWIPLGVLNGYPVGSAIADGDGFLFFGFALLLAAAALYGHLAWLRRWILVCCAINAVFLATLFALAASRIVPGFQLRDLLLNTFDFGGQVTFLQNGLFRLHLASGLFLQVGVALVCWELIRSPRRWWPWLLMAVLLAALAGTYARGYWLGAFIAAAIVLVFGRQSAGFAARHKRTLVVVLTLVVAIATLGLSVTSVGGGAGSSYVKVYQAWILLGQFLERPFVGWGFGAVAANYPYSDHFSYEITYLDRAFKLGIVGLALFLSLPLRLLHDSVRVFRGRLPVPPKMPAREAIVPLAIIVSVLVITATNPYMAGSVGIGAVILCIAWLDPFGRTTDATNPT